jgi:hypothetical protein
VCAFGQWLLASEEFEKAADRSVIELISKRHGLRRVIDLLSIFDIVSRFIDG